ncbi:hypothetical protein AQUCO_01100373v1 [Aquilegia coerulea]|uniref:Probable Ufm1-specific protease n=1 Tax=Aquilegia coerulea TaxID=218851 RepID=A0A2G5E6X0_AQUCA|nr:hypothetical protein AQUCO_01100373v1 [Aquilegia coerulea]
MEIENQRNMIRVLCRKQIITNKEKPGFYWLIGSPFLPQYTIISTFKCLHFIDSPNDSLSPDYSNESDDLRTLLLRGFNVIGALVVVVENQNQNWEEHTRKAIESTRRIRKLLCRGDERLDLVGAAADLSSGDIRYFICSNGSSSKVESVSNVVYEESPEKFVWEKGCLLRCELEMKLPIYYPVNKPSDSVGVFSSAVDAAIAKLQNPNAVFTIEGSQAAFDGVSQTTILRGLELDFRKDLSDIKLSKNTVEESGGKTLFCSDFCSENKTLLSFIARESADTIKVNVFFNHSRNSENSSAPIAYYFPASDPSKLVVVSFKIEVLCYALKDVPVAYAVSLLIVPGLGDQLTLLKKAFMPNLLKQHPQLRPFHFCPLGFLHPITAIYELSYGETEMKQVEVRRSLHLRLGLPLDRPLLIVANALNFATNKGVAGSNSMRNASALLKDVHREVPSSGVSGGLISWVDGSYEYYHYLHDGFDDSGWGCAYRSLQTIISWFRLQHYTSTEVPSHREIQQALVEIGDKDPSFSGSREWIGAIELSFVLDKLLGVTCKIMNVRSGAELPEKCRELALHFETQGTPVMIGGGVLAYTLLGVDYNEASGDCAFLILDPHYTGNDDHKKIVNGGWCGWKKAVDSKGRNFFLHDKFYNLLLPQRPNIV